jgi:hypothetical protein
MRMNPDRQTKTAASIGDALWKNGEIGMNILANARISVKKCSKQGHAAKTTEARSSWPNVTTDGRSNGCAASFDRRRILGPTTDSIKGAAKINRASDHLERASAISCRPLGKLLIHPSPTGTGDMEKRINRPAARNQQRSAWLNEPFVVECRFISFHSVQQECKDCVEKV